MTRVLTNVLVGLVCLAIVVPGALVALGVLPYKVYVVHTGSMSPTIPADSAVIVRRGVYRVGQVITFNTVNGVVTHRLVGRRSDGSLITKGDANRTADPGLTSPSAVIGGVVAAPPLLGYLLMYLRNPVGLASVVLFIIILWLVFSMAGTRSPMRQQAGAQAPTDSRDPNRRGSVWR